VNEPVVQEVPAIVPGPDGQPTVGTQQVVVEVKNRPAEMDMDIIIEAVPNTANVQQEQFAELVKLAGIYGPQEVPFDDLLEVSNLPHKRQIVEKRQARQQEAAQAQGPQQQAQQMAMQVQMEREQAETEEKQASAVYKAAQAEGQQLENTMNALATGVQVGAAM